MGEHRSREERLAAVQALAADLNAEPLLTDARFQMPTRLGDRDDWPPAFAAFDRIVGRHEFLEWHVAHGKLGKGKFSEPVLALQAPYTEDPQFVLIQLRTNELHGPQWRWRLYS